MSDFQKFRDALEGEYVWPAPYTFKFLIREHQLEDLKATIEMEQFSVRPSKNGNYLAITFTKMIVHTDHVIEIYQSVQKIPGIICL